jgi:protein-tyrosine phosphatase
MFKLFSKSKPSPAEADLSGLNADMHSHLLPGIDDGSPDIETSLKLIRAMNALGYKKLITTPHVMWDMYKNTHEIILEKEALLKAAVKEAGIEVEVRAAAEYFLDDHAEQLIKSGEKLLTIGSNMVLVEFSMAYPSHSLKDILFELQMQNYQPVIAHPERYLYLEKTKDFYDELKDLGCLFQLNLLSVAGYYGKSANDLALYLIKKNYYDLVGTDLHGERHLAALKEGMYMQTLEKLLETGKLKNTEL